MIVQTFNNRFAIDNPAHREHLDRRRLDLVDLCEEIRAIRQAARDPHSQPHRIEISLDTTAQSQDQRFDHRHFTELTIEALSPEDERNHEAVTEFARWARAWPKESLATFRQVVSEAARSDMPLHTQRLAASLPPRLAAGMSHISEEIWSHQAKATMHRQVVRDHGLGMTA